MRSVRVIVRGRVQGVGFRWFVKDAAEAHDVSGWVRNLRDGSVEAELRGEDPAIQAVVDAISDGPAGSRVDNVRTTDATSPAPTPPAASPAFAICTNV